MKEIKIKGYVLDADRFYTEDHYWIEVLESGRSRIGMDPLGVETAGDIVQLVMQEPGMVLQRGDAFGSLEAAKFVGPMTLPLSARILSRNEDVLDNPGLVQKDPLGDGWLLELELSNPAELDLLMKGEEQIAAWFGAKVDEYKLKGVLAE